MKPIANSLQAQCLYLDVNKPVYVYRNLHRKMFSVKQGVVRFHTVYIALKEVEFIVREKGRQRVLAEKQKNVHGFVKGFLNTDFINEYMNMVSEYDGLAHYDPYKYSSFMCGDDPIYTADKVVMCMIDERSRIACKKSTEKSNY